MGTFQHSITWSFMLFFFVDACRRVSLFRCEFVVARVEDAQELIDKGGSHSSFL
jgi:hypothetical protein